MEPILFISILCLTAVATQTVPPTTQGLQFDIYIPDRKTSFTTVYVNYKKSDVFSQQNPPINAPSLNKANDVCEAHRKEILGFIQIF